MKNIVNSVFIAYHGSGSIGGTEVIGKQFETEINTRYPVRKAYCGPNTNERTFAEHAGKVIPESAMFLFVVNDMCPQDERGCLNKETSAYLYGEIKAFYDLYKLGERNKKDFAVFYCGNERKNDTEAMAYVKRLLADIDPACELCTGNQYYIVNRVSFDHWINDRLVNVNKSVLTDEKYYPFSLLQKKVEEILQNERSAVFVLQMEKGMGKTTFVRALAADEEFQRGVAVKPVYVSRACDYASPESFAWEISDLLRQDGSAVKRQTDVAPMNLVGADLAEEFSRFVNEFKAKRYADRKLFLIVDGIDDMGSVGARKITDFFEGARFDDGVYVMFTCRVFHESNSSENPAYEFIRKFKGEKLVFKSDSAEYLRFLYNYFNNNIIASFSKGEKKLDEREIFAHINPKNILAFSILLKISEIYFQNTPTDAVDVSVLCSLESALGFYYNYMTHELNSELLAEYRKLLCVLALSDYALTSKELKTAFDIDFDSERLAQNDFLRIFVKECDDRPVTFGFVHDKIKRLILSDHGEVVNGLLGGIYFDLCNAFRPDVAIEKLFAEHGTLINFLPALLQSDTLTAREKDELTERALALPFALSWTKPLSVAEPERRLLRILADRLEKTPSLCERHHRQVACVYAVLAHDCFLLNYFFECAPYYELSEKHYALYGIEQAPDEAKREYAEMLTIYGTYCQQCGRTSDALVLLQRCVALVDEIYPRGGIPFDDYVHHRVACSNIYHSCKDYANQKKVLDEAKKIGGKRYREENPARYAFMNVSYYWHYSSKGNWKKAARYIDVALKYYKIHYERDWKSMFVGDMVACVALKIDLLTRFCKNKKRCLAEAKELTAFVAEAAERTGFKNPSIDLRVPEALAALYAEAGLREECRELCEELLTRFDALLAAGNKDFAMFYWFRKRVEVTLAKVS